MNAIATLVISGLARLAKTWGGHDVRSQPEEGEEEGDAGELVPGRELKLAEMPLDEAQFNALVGERAWNSFFDTSPGKIAEQLHDSYSRLKLDSKYKNCVVALVFGVSAKSLAIGAATIKNLSVKFTKAGPQLSCTIVGTRPRTMEVLDLEDFGGKLVTVSLTFGPPSVDAEQQELGLQPAATNGEAPAAPAKRGRPRKQSNAEHAVSH